MQIDSTKGGLENLYRLLNNGPHVFGANNVSVGSPSVAAGNNGRNTSVIITALPNKGFSGVRTVSYKRPTLAQAVITATTTFAIVEGETAEAFTVRVLGLLGLRRSDITLSSGATLPVPSLATPEITVTISAAAGSYLYSSSTRNIVVKLSTVTLTNLPSFMDAAGSTGWTNNATRGWYNNSSNSYWLKRYVNISAATAAKIKQVRGTFSSNSANPADGVASNWIELIYTDDTVEQFGISNLNDAFGGQLILQVNGTSLSQEGNIVDLTLLKTANAGKTLRYVAIVSNLHTSGGATLRGVKDVKLLF